MFTPPVPPPVASYPIVRSGAEYGPFVCVFNAKKEDLAAVNTADGPLAPVPITTSCVDPVDNTPISGTFPTPPPPPPLPPY
jgi:hypothetical protein